uniref:Thyroglobulin type-1 domain-containing protein n=1 Tax=Anabas testudineus TaxID=64144 RepID=A0A3Q1JN64_ANATE
MSPDEIRTKMYTGTFCPQCDANGNFLPRQCWASTGYCWCVDVISGKMIPNTETPPGVEPVDCGE